jgi:ketol-acid reductoisomerase
MTVIYYEADADITVLANQTIGIVGYGSLGKAIAGNLRDNNLPPIIGGSNAEEQAQAEADGFVVTAIADLTGQADIIMLLMPDEFMAQTYMEAVSPNLRRGHTLIFASAYNVAFGFIEPPPFVDVGLVAPRIEGETIRKHYRAGNGFLSFVSVAQDASRHAWDTVLAVALAIGSLKTGAVEVSIEQEAALNLFVQQAILPAFYHIVTAAAQLLMKQGYPAEAVLTDLYLSGKFSDTLQRVAQSGLLHTLRQSSKTGQYGTFSRVGRFNELKLERLMEVCLEEIRNGKFAHEWSQEYADGHPRLTQLLRQQESLELWELEQQTREFFGWEDGE